LNVGGHRSDRAQPWKILVWNLKFESLFNLEEEFDNGDRIEPKIISQMMGLGNGCRVSLKIAGERMDNFFCDLRVDPFSHYQCSFGGMNQFVVKS